MTDPSQVRDSLTRILSSRSFQGCDAQARLLRSAVENALAGRPFPLKDGPAAKLRTRLAEYYGSEGQQDAVRIEIPSDGSPAAFSSVATPERRTPRRLWVWAPAALVAAALLVWGGFYWHARMASAQIRSLAILPFADMTPGHNDWFAASFTGEIVDELTRAPGLKVTARTSALRGKKDELGAAAVLEGSIRRSGHDFHVTLQMTRSSDGYRLWSARFDRSAKDVPAVERRIAEAIAARLRVHMPAPLEQRHQPDEQAYEAYLEGRYFFDQGNPDGLNQAAGRLQEATRIDPDFAAAWAWLSIVREYRVEAGLARANRAMPGSRDAAEHAIVLDPESADAHLALGIVKLQYDWDWAGAKAELDRALEANPGSVFALEWQARWLETQGRTSEAVAEIEQVLQLDPLNGGILREAAAQYVALGQPDRALPLAQKAADLNPDDAATRVALADVLLSAGQKDKSRQVMEELRQSPAGAKLAPSVLPSLAARMGNPEDARQLLDQAEDLPDEELLPAVDYAKLAASIQDWDRLFSWTEEAYGERDIELPYWRENPLIPKSDPRFDAFLAEMNLPAPAAR